MGSLKYRDLRQFLGTLEERSLLRRVTQNVSPKLEMTALADVALRQNGPALLFERPDGFHASALVNLFGTPERVALGMGAESPEELRQIGALLASLREPEPPRGLSDAGRVMGLLSALWNMKPSRRSDGPCREVCLEGLEVDLAKWPIQSCWPGDVAPLITWGLVITRGPQGVPKPRVR